MAEVLSGKEDAAGRGADGSSGVVMGEADSFFGQLVNIGSLDFGLSVGAEFAISEVIGQNKNDVGLGLGGDCGGD